MVFRSRRKISTKTARNMLTWNHYRFKTQLINKAREYPNCRVMSTLAKLAINVYFFIARLEAQKNSNVQDVTKNLIETLMQLEIFY
jgi:hypothetical protein